MASKLYGGSGKDSTTKAYVANHTNRRVLKSPVFESRDEVMLYVGGNKITCLECGEDFIQLGSHIAQAHRGLSCADYRKKYNIPYDVPLVGANCLEVMKARGAHSVSSPEGRDVEQRKLDKAMEKLCAKNGLPRGVQKLKNGRYKARYVKGKEYHIGTYNTPEEAGEAALKFREAFTKTN